MGKIVKNPKKAKMNFLALIIFAIVLVGLMAFVLSGENLEIVKQVFKEDVTKEEVREHLSSLGFRAYFTIGVLSMLQVVMTFLPAEPVQVVAGISFGLLNGSLICLAGVILGNTIIFVLSKFYAQKMTDYFTYNAEFDFESARKSPKVAIVIFILYFLPAIPYGLICFFASSLNLKYYKYILLTSVGSIPSILMGVALGHVAISTSWVVSIIVFVVLLILLVILFVNKSKVFAKVNEYMKRREMRAGIPREPNKFFLSLLVFATRIAFDTRLKVRVKNNVGKLKRPCVVLCNHGSFTDFVYAGRLIAKEKPHFIAARLYFYNKRLNWLLRSLGTLPKSMFATDIENVKGCMHVISSEGVLAMMPEARLSTVGRYEGAHETTYRFIQRLGVAVYTVNICGDYFAQPKWGDGLRNNSLIEAELNPLFEEGEITDMPYEEFKNKIDNALKYDEFKWLETRPEQVYKKKTLAEGLENILSVCPSCGAEYSITTKKRDVICSKCGSVYTLDDRYAFIDKKPFENFAEWYDWQNGVLKNKIVSDENFKLESKVVLRHASTDGKTLTRYAGEGVCTFNRDGLTYIGTRDGEQIEKFFPMEKIYRLLFGAGEDFEIYEGKEIWYFVPEEKRSCVTWYVASGILKELTEGNLEDEKKE